MRCWNCQNSVPFREEPCHRCGVSLKPQRLNRVLLAAALSVAAVVVAVVAL